MIKAESALDRLKVGNHRFVEGNLNREILPSIARRSMLVGSQQPFAIILGCSDSRVPAEIVFDQGLGDLFVIRVAGNIIAPSGIGSVEYAAEQFGCRLVVVLGHTQCGAVIATLDQLRRAEEARSKNLRSIVGRIRPSIECLLDSDLKDEPEALLEASVRANIRASVSQLREGSDILKQMVDDQELLIVGAEYSLQTGVVEFFSQAP
ncbi:MAG: carbonic anhydrase [Xanthomonadales bacterium]|jgi:carbonic anhydrase|nr:carbonic anhydrase [Xanthomonadales bacterium]MDH4001124.1 carbonic anhydrase [Xanthomonadales bacterium]